MLDGRSFVPTAGLFALIGVIFFFACSNPPPVQMPALYNAEVVMVQEGDTLASLAAKYLSDPSKSHIIAEFNLKSSIVPGQQIIIPLIPLRRGGLQSSGYQTVPMLRYEKFSESPAGPSAVSRRAFESQMRFLQDQGYQVISIDKFMEFLDFKDQIPQKSVVISIDDGWKSFFEVAYPVLKKYGYPATLFVQPDMIGNKGALSWQQLIYMSGEGLDVQCRMRTHRDLKRLQIKNEFNRYLTELDRELLESKAAIESKLGKTCRYLAYPDGPTNSLLIAFAKKHGFRAGFRSRGSANPFFIGQYQIGRATVSGNDDLAVYQSNLTVQKAMTLE